QAFQCKLEIVPIEEPSFAATTGDFFTSKGVSHTKLMRDIAVTMICFRTLSEDAAIAELNTLLERRLCSVLASDGGVSGVSSIHIAALHGNMVALRSLIEIHGADVNA